MNDRETILGLIERYKTAIHTGAAVVRCAFS